MRDCALFLLLTIVPVTPAAARRIDCPPLESSPLRHSTDTCIAAHVYDVVTVEGGTRFLDVCSPEVSDADCHLAIVTYPADTSSVGNLDGLRGQDIRIRGPVQRFGEHYIMSLNDQRQLHGQPARFRPDPRLACSFAAEGEQPSDAPELKVNFHHHGRKLGRQ